MAEPVTWNHRFNLPQLNQLDDLTARLTIAPMTQELTASWDRDLTFIVSYYAGCPEKGESGYSLGEPAEPARVDIEHVAYQGNDVTAFVMDYADHLMDDWQERLFEQISAE